MDNDIFSQPVDQDALNLTHAIALTETGSGGKPNYNAVGDNGTSHGAYQWQPGNFAAAASQYGLDPNDMSPANQDKVAYAQVKSMKDQGLQPYQIASAWNSGSPDNYQNHSGTTVINGKSIHYDTPAYVQKVKDYYTQIAGGTQPTTDTPSNADTTTPAPTPVPGQGKTVAGNLIRGLVRPLVRAVNTPIEGAQKLLGMDTSNETDTYLGDVSGYGMKAGQTTGQRLKDIGGGALETAALAVPGLGEAGEAAEGAEALSTAEKAAQAAKTGAIIGGAGGAGNELDTNPNATLGSTLTAGLKGAVGGATIGGAIPVAGNAISEGADKLSSLFGSKSAEDIASMARDPNVTQADINKMSAPEQEQYFKEKAGSVNEDAKAQRATRTAEAQATVQQADQEVKQFQEQAGTAASDKAESLKEPAKQLLKDQSQRYVQLTQEAAAQAEGSALEKAVPATDLSSAIDEKFADTDTRDNSTLRASLKSDLGLTGDEEQKVTNQEILDKAKSIMQTVSKSSRSGASVYSPSDYEAMQKYSFLMDQLDKNGLDLTEANAFWKKWAPTRDRIVREVKPFDETGVKGSPFSKTLLRANKTGGTALQTASKIDAQKFVSELEDRLGVPKGSLGKEVSEALQGADKAKLSKETAEQVLKEAKDAIAKDKAEALKTMSQQKYTAQSAARKKALIKKAVLYTLGAIGIVGGGSKVIEKVL